MSDQKDKKFSKPWIIDYFGFQDKTFYRSVFQICIPMAIQQAINLFIQFADNVMVGALGDVSVASVTLVAQVPFFMLILSMGACAAGTTFTSQQWGRGEIGQIRKTFGLVQVTVFIIAGVFLIPSQLIPAPILDLFSDDPLVIAEGVDYLRILAWGFPFQAVTFALSAILRSTEEVKLPTIATLVGVVTNVVLNYALIFGELGFPRMEVAGAAIATIIAHAANCIFLVIATYVVKHPIVTDKTPMLRDFQGFPKRFFKVGLPVMGNEGLWAIAQIAIVFVYAQLGTQMTAAMGIFGVIERISFVFFMALANGCVVIAGKEIGKGLFDLGFLYCQRLRRLVIVLAVVAAVLINLLGPILLSFYRVGDFVKLIVRCNLLVPFLKMPFDAHNFMLIVGALRAGGDTRYAFVIDSGAQILLMLPCVMLGAFVVQVPLQWVYAFTIPPEIIKYLVGRHRFYGKKWMNVLK